MTILIVRLGALGDIVHAIPPAAALRRAHPDAEIHWVVAERHRAIVDLVTVVDRVIAVGPGLEGWRRAVEELRASRYDVAIDLQGLLKSAVLARASGASRVFGFSIWHLREKAARPFYSEVRSADDIHVIAKNLRLLEAVDVRDTAVTFPLADVRSEAVDEIRRRIGPTARFALINPGAAWPNKRWPPDRFGQVAEFLRETCALAPVVLWGPGEEALANEVIAASSGTAVLAPPTSVPDIVALARDAALIVSGDTGPLHLAVAVGTPVVSIFGPTDPARNGPIETADVIVSRFGACGCHYDRRCHQREWCLLDVSATEVCAAVKRRLRNESDRG